jgi:hypothetical protein
MAEKRKRVVLDLNQKTEIIKRLKNVKLPLVLLSFMALEEPQ